MDLEAEETVSTDRAALSGPIANSFPACATGTWCQETSPTTGSPLLHAVSAVSASDVFAVGDSGTIIRRSPTAWTTMTSGTTNNLRGVWAISSSDVWAVGSSGTILHFNGTAWSAVSGGGTTNLEAVWASGSSDVWICGGGTVLHWNGSSVSSAASFTPTLLSISGTSASDVWVAAENGGFHHWNGSAWSAVTPITGTSSYFAVLAIGANDVWTTTITSSKQSVHWNGTKWTTFATPTSTTFNDLAANSTNDVWGTAGSGKIGHWNGTAWSVSQPFGTSFGGFWSVATTATDIWAVGDGATIAHMPL
ncbi:MAG TPA: hypothetical protein VFP84_05190 [Kofleriaceae bacterium]|nr:hypothetical protein [Kofleriaceae bacterium]